MSYKMDTAKLHAQERLVDYKDSVVDAVDRLVDELKQRTDEVICSVKHSLSNPDRLMDSIGTNAERVFSARTADTIKDAIETDAAYAVAFKDQLVGGVREAVGHLLRDDQLAREGHRQVAKGKSEVALHRSLAEEKQHQKQRAQIVVTLMRRESLMNQIAFVGGFERFRSSMRHVETRERDDQLFADLFPRSAGKSFALKRFDVQPLLKDIREHNTPRPLVFIVPRERDAIRAQPYSKKELAAFGHITNDSRRADLLAAIRRSDVQKLRAVPFDRIRDRSGVRFELLHGLHQAEESRQRVLHDIVDNEQEQKQKLVHVMEVDDKASPAAFFAKNGFDGIHKQFEVQPLAKGAVLGSETRQSTALTHN
jgi:uncharacterized protein YjbJ (UPF0337 family)